MVCPWLRLGWRPACQDNPRNPRSPLQRHSLRKTSTDHPRRCTRVSRSGYLILVDRRSLHHQGDEQDLRRELVTMPEIYQHATVTITAAWSTKADAGFLYHRKHWYQFCPPIKLQIQTTTRQGSDSEEEEGRKEGRRNP